MALRGITVIEMAGLAPAPFCGMVLADFGARVIRVDKPRSPNYDRLGRGKQSVVVNLKNKEGVNVVRRLCKNADVLVEPFRPGVMERLNLGPEILTKENPKLIYARLTGYGQSGPMSHMAGHDINYVATSGVLSKLGRRGEKPYFPLNILADFAGGGLMCAMGIVMALLERTKSGKGQVIDCSMVDGVAYVATWPELVKEFYFANEKGTNILDGGSAFYETYETKDGKHMAVGALEPQFYKALLQGLNLDPEKVKQFDDQKAQSKLFRDIFLTKTRAEWTEVFTHLDACVTPVLSVEEAADHPHNKERGMYMHGSWPSAPDLLHSAPAPRLSRTPAEGTSVGPLPETGEHTVDVLREQGFSQEELQNLVSKGAIGVKERL